VPKPDHDKILGSLTGLAACEAMAACPEAPAQDAPLGDGMWGDGTSMALSLAESLAESGGVDERDQMIRLTSWYRYGYQSAGETCEHIDEQVKAAVMRFERTWDPEDRDMVQGDACLARVAPAAVFFAGSRDDVLDACARSVRTTHGGPQSVDACLVLAAMVHEALNGADKERVLRPDLPESLSPEAASVCTPTPEPGDYAACRALAAAVAAFSSSASFAEGCGRCLPYGSRALAAYGQLAGSWYGLKGIPEAWRKSLARPELIERAADLLTGA
jgi:ADP-ribosyl-[dinitrogen reductase] hydrolase